MNPAIESAAATYVAPKVMKNFKFRWVLYGVAAYFGLKYLNKRGILPNQTGAALDLIDRGLDVAKRQIGFTGKSSNVQSDASSRSQSILTH